MVWFRSVLFTLFSLVCFMVGTSVVAMASPLGSRTTESYRVLNPTSGVWQYVKVTRSPTHRGQNLPAIVMCPGGTSDSTLFDSGTQSASGLAEQGFVVVTYDPDGRGRTAGTEDYNGFVHQDGLAAVVEFAANRLGGVDGENVGIFTNSRGVITAAGMLARYPDTPARYLIDWEGPSDRYYCGCEGESDSHIVGSMSGCDDDAFWSEREAVNFLPSILVPYQRIQSESDHVHRSDTSHAVVMVNAATQGLSPWTRLNDEPENAFYSEEPAMLADAAVDSNTVTYISRYADEILGLGL